MEFINLLASFILCFLCFQPEFAFSTIAADREALIRLSSAVRGNTITWNISNPSPCNWTGVTCDDVINRVTELRLPGDGLIGPIPVGSIGNLTELRTLSLRNNALTGVLPIDLEFCTQLQFLYLQNNQLSGEIPASFYNLTNLLRLDISGNILSGEISPNFGNFTRLSNLYLQNNQFTGSIPDFNINLSQFNVSINRLTGRIPNRLTNFPANSFTGNELCGPPLTPCPNQNKTSKLSGGAIAGIVIGSVIGSILSVSTIYLLTTKFKNSRNSNQAVQDAPSTIPPSPEKPYEFDFRSPDHIMANENTGSDEAYSGRVESVGPEEMTFFGDGGFLLDDLLRASAEVLGKGFVGITYKAYLGCGEVIVKRLKNVCVSKREFTKRVVAIGEVWHENLVPVKGYYFGKEEKLVVFDFVPMGSLFSLLHGNMEERFQLTLEIRSKLAFDVANALDHLHSHNLSHGNIKSNNILLTPGFQARVSESGLIQLVSFPTPNLSGYRAPELLDTRITSKEADVYSFGILLLELLTGQDPTVLLNEEGVDLPTWVQSVDEARWDHDVVETGLIKDAGDLETSTRLLHLGIRCASQVPRRRGSMAEVSRQIRKICKL